MIILLIDDEHRKAQPLIDYMEVVRQWSVYVANGPSQALRIMGNEERLQFDLVVLDIMMDPQGEFDLKASDKGLMTGVLLIEKINSLLGDTPIIILSARIDLGYLEDEGRVAAVIQKPSSAKSVVEKIDQILAGDEG